MDEILAEFIAETRETLESVAEELVAWEADPTDRDRLDAIFRFVHTVKGSCGFLDLPRLERLSHAAEDALSGVRADMRVPDRALVNGVLAIIDRIGVLAAALESGDIVSDHDDDDVLIAALCPHAISNMIAENPAEQITLSTPSRSATRSIRISLELLDRMMSGVSDLVLARNEVSRCLQDGDADASIMGAFERLSTCVGDMRDTITRTRMQRIEKLFSAIPRMVRDISAELGKLVTLDIGGSDVELDREMIEMIRDPLTHIIRNALDHGIETPADRVAQGKSATGRLCVTARQSGNQIVIDVADDGRGIDSGRLVEKAIAAGVITAARAELLSAEAKLNLIFEPGLSTANTVTALSGRGVGMDVVRSNIEKIGGVVDVDSVPGRGLTLCIRVPLTLTIIPALTISVSGLDFAIPRSAIQEIVRDNNHNVVTEMVGGAAIARIRNQRLPVVELETALDLERTNVDAVLSLIILNLAGGARYALSVSGLHDHQELVIRPACPVVMSAGVYAGMTLPDTGRPMLLLDPAGIAEKSGISAQSLVQEDVVAQSDAPIEETISLLLFRDIDGVERAIRLGVVDRIEDVEGDTVQYSAGQLRITLDGRIVPIIGLSSLINRKHVTILRLHDGTSELAYAIDEVIDIVAQPANMTPTLQAGMIAGVGLIQGRHIEILDPHWLFADIALAPANSRDKPLCLFPDKDDPWMREVLRPLVEAAGYHVAFTGDVAPDSADIIIATDEHSMGENIAPAKILRLHNIMGAQTDGVYRYDRAGLMTALQNNRGRGQ